ncbi:MAG: retropepsin-like domain-containing protein [Myxococcales bacterium]|nr:retropepsin-like domain-containing protein [Myxococcales bacterium]
MRRLAFTWMTLVGLGISAGCLRVPPDLPEEPNATPAAPSTAAEVLARFIEATGGEKALRSLPARTIEARMTVRAQPGCEPGDETCLAEDQVGSFLLRTTADGKLYRRTVLGELVEEKGYDGKQGWQLAGDVIRLENEQEQALSQEDAVLHWYFDLAERGIEVTLVRPRKEDREGKVTVLDGIHWELPGSGASPKTMWFERSTGLLREEVVEEGEGDQLQRQTIVYEDYRDIDGIKVPHLIRVINEIGEQEQIVEFLSQRVDHRPVEPGLFAMPELPAPEPVPDQRVANVRAAQAAADADPKDASAQIELVRAAWAAGHFDTAIAAAKATLALDPKEPEALVLLARGHVLRGELKEAQAVLRKASSVGLKPDLLARELAWIHYRRREFDKLARDLDAAGSPVLAGRFRSFVGKPLQAKGSKGCVTRIPMVATQPLAVVQIEIDDEPVSAIVDTGASDLILSHTFATARGISVRPLGQTPPGMPNVGFGQAESVTLGDVTLGNVPVDVFDDRAMADMAGDALPEVKAVVGMSLLADFQVTVDVPGEVLELVGSRCKSDLQARRVGEGVPFWQHETHYIYVMARMNDAEGIYLVNTGMRGADLTATQLAYGHAGIGAPVVRDDAAPMVEVASFVLGDTTLPKLAAAYGFFEQTSTSDGFRLDGMIGLGVMGQRRWTLDFETRRIYFSTPAGATDAGAAKAKAR